MFKIKDNIIEKFNQKRVALKLEKKLPLGITGIKELNKYKIEDKSIKFLSFKYMDIALKILTNKKPKIKIKPTKPSSDKISKYI